MVCELLKMSGARAKSATSGRESLQMIAAQVFDVVLSDISMPEMDGFELLLRRIHMIPEAADLSALALTSFGRPEDVERAQAAGFVSHLTKPIDAAALIKALQTIPLRVLQQCLNDVGR